MKDQDDKFFYGRSLPDSLRTTQNMIDWFMEQNRVVWDPETMLYTIDCKGCKKSFTHPSFVGEGLVSDSAVQRSEEELIRLAFEYCPKCQGLQKLKK